MSEEYKLKLEIKHLEEELELSDNRLEKSKSQDEVFNKLITMGKAITNLQELMIVHISTHKEKNVEDVNENLIYIG